jgi:hypothetical protein
MTLPTAPGPAVTWPANNNDWYVIQAIGNTDLDTDVIYMRASSLGGDVYVLDQE